MPGRNGPAPLQRLRENILLRVLLYYAALAILFVVVRHVLPSSIRAALELPIQEVTGGGGLGRAAERLAERGELPPTEQVTLGLASILAILTAALLALPVCWIYILTRAKKGYRQSVVQTLIILPVIVAGVVVLVKHSLALAFSLAGIVAAVRFRNTLDDSKDAAYIFLATAIGLASGVQVIVAAVMSVSFNLLVLVLWYADFGRSPAALEGARAQERMRRAMSMASRTGTFVARLDDELLKVMSPEQLDALADRAWRRKKRMSPDFEDDDQPALDTLLRVRTAQPDAVRARLEPALGERVARWRFGHVLHETDGTHIVEYGVELHPGTGVDELLDEVRRLAEPHALDAEVR